MDHLIVGIAAEPHTPQMFGDPSVEGIVQEQVGQQRAYDTALRRALRPLNLLTFRRFQGCFEPALDIQQHSGSLAVLANCPYQQFMVDIVEQSFDVKLDHPVVLPTASPDQGNRIMRRAPGSVTV